LSPATIRASADRGRLVAYDAADDAWEALATAAPRRLIASVLVLLVGAAGLLSAPARASTESELEDARRKLEAAQSELDRVTGLWQQTETRLAEAQDAATLARAKITILQHELALSRKDLSDRVAAAFMAGGAMPVGAILTADSVQDATDRLEYAQSVVQSDADLATEVAVQVEELRREEAILQRAVDREEAAAADLQAQRDQLAERVDDLNSLVSDLKAELDAEQQRELGLSGSVTVTGSGAIQTCPVAGPNSFVDSFGWPRPGGRVHQGIDLIAAYGTPVVAVAPGSARTASNTLGGNAVVVQHTSGDWTYYAHLSSFGTMGAVSAGTVIGYVGSTGDTNVNHLHFEYHPNGGAAVDPYSALLAVC
jgi:murein DD-endopeptidase MepM/ murein hydrolase activator NlpD